MSHKKSCFFAVSIFIFAGFSPVAAGAEPVDVSKLDTTELRALFQSPPFRDVSSPGAYGEDYSGTPVTGHPALVPSRTHSNTPSVPAVSEPADDLLTDQELATSIMRDMLRNPEFAVLDGLDDYDEDF